MIWGEVVNAVRSLHLELLEQFNVSPKVYFQDIELETAQNISFPSSMDDFEEWEWPMLPPTLQDSLELHPVERALIEGPLLPIEKVRFKNIEALDELLRQVIMLEREWLKKVQLSSPEMDDYIEQSLKAKWLKLQTRGGFNRLKAV